MSADCFESAFENADRRNACEDASSRSFQHWADLEDEMAQFESAGDLSFESPWTPLGAEVDAELEDLLDSLEVA